MVPILRAVAQFRDFLEHIEPFAASYRNALLWLASLLVPLVTAWLVLSDLGRCYRLLSRMYAGTPQGGLGPIAALLSQMMLKDLIGLKLFKSHMLRRVRMHVEHAIFHPRPVFVWPLPEDDPDYDTPGLRAADGAAGRARARQRHAQELAQWRRGIGRIYRKGDQQLIQVDTPATVNAHFSDIKRYFDTLKSLGLDAENEEDGDGRKFVCPILIATGFVAPIHLLTGLLVQFNEKWKTILQAFDRDANDRSGLRDDQDSAALRPIQLFIYNCWLLWGPSVPICTCKLWYAPYIAVQYGFGDENNSIELVGEREMVVKDMNALLISAGVKLTDGGNAPMPMARQASVRGRLQLSGSFKDNSGTGSPLPHAVLASWGGQQDERPVLFISETETGDAAQGDLAMTEKKLGYIADSAAPKSKYYSAYLWAAFVMLRQDGQRWVEVRGDAAPWKNIIPFFEHGNLADAEACFFFKNQLVAKALGGIARIVRRWPAGAAPNRFAFACAIDDCGCGQPPAFPDWAGGTTIRDLLKDTLAKKAQDREEGDLYARIVREQIVTFDYYNAAEDMHDYSACNLPHYIDENYKSMEA